MEDLKVRRMSDLDVVDVLIMGIRRFREGKRRMTVTCKVNVPLDGQLTVSVKW